MRQRDKKKDPARESETHRDRKTVRESETQREKQRQQEKVRQTEKQRQQEKVRHTERQRHSACLSAKQTSLNSLVSLPGVQASPLHFQHGVLGQPAGGFPDFGVAVDVPLLLLLVCLPGTAEVQEARVPCLPLWMLLQPLAHLAERKVST